MNADEQKREELLERRRQQVLEAKQQLQDAEQPQQDVVFKELRQPRTFSFVMLLIILGSIALPFVVLIVSSSLGLQGFVAIVSTVLGIIYVLSPIIALSYLREIRNEVVKIRRETQKHK